MKQVLKFKENSVGWYVSTQMEICGSVLLDYFDVEDKFELHVSTRKPSDDDEYYTLVRDDSNGYWVFADGPEEGCTITTTEMDEFLDRHFSGKVYAWAVSWEEIGA